MVENTFGHDRIYLPIIEEIILACWILKKSREPQMQIFRKSFIILSTRRYLPAYIEMSMDESAATRVAFVLLFWWILHIILLIVASKLGSIVRVEYVLDLEENRSDLV